mmetsp:Transcript_6613/g.10633  ORF Transcript_6613/g.10633 Transcript_6613/m.10633 type:complete len:93 (+) Transcript_6613:442-720(+)
MLTAVHGFYRDQYTAFVKSMVEPEEGFSSPITEEEQKSLYPYFCWQLAKSLIEKYDLPLTEDTGSMLNPRAKASFKTDFAFRLLGLLFFPEI